MGFKTNNMDGYIGEITIGEGKDDQARVIGILCHVDVVDGGSGWKTEPFVPVIKDGKMYGRGSIDDKGPLLASLYAMKYMNDNKLIPDNSEIRLIIGTNEEEEWGCIDHYVNTAERLPDYSIVPDANFPLISCEKGLLDFNLISRLKKQSEPTAETIYVVDLKGGTARNVVPDSAYCQIRIEDQAVREHVLKMAGQEGKIDAVCENKFVDLTAKGKSCHCMSPEKGDNAISILLSFLYSLNADIRISDMDLGEFLTKYMERIGFDYYGELLGINAEDEESGKLTMSIGKIRIDNDTVHMEAGVRYPASMEFKSIEDSLRRRIRSTGWDYEYIDSIKPIYFSDESSLVKKLMAAYMKVTGDLTSKPLAIGGATYARALPNAVAFGPLFPDEEELAHEADEFIDLDNLLKSVEIYVEGIRGLFSIE